MKKVSELFERAKKLASDLVKDLRANDIVYKNIKEQFVQNGMISKVDAKV